MSTTGTLAIRGSLSARSARQTARPSCPGIIQSSTTTSGRSARASASAASPSPAERTRKPSGSSVSSSTAITSGSSSATSAVAAPLGRARAPREMLGVFLQRVLGVVEEQVGAGQELDVPLVLCVDRRAALGRPPLGVMARMGLVVGGVDERDAARLEPVAERGRRMIQVARDDAHSPQLERALGELVIADGGGQLAERHREVGVLHLPGEDLLQRSPEL